MFSTKLILTIYNFGESQVNLLVYFHQERLLVAISEPRMHNFVIFWGIKRIFKEYRSPSKVTFGWGILNLFYDEFKKAMFTKRSLIRYLKLLTLTEDNNLAWQSKHRPFFESPWKKSGKSHVRRTVGRSCFTSASFCFAFYNFGTYSHSINSQSNKRRRECGYYKL